MNIVRTLRTFVFRLCSFALLVALSPFAFSQTGGSFDLSWNTIDGGGHTFSTGSTFELGGTVGQPDASNALSGGSYSLTGGFWFPSEPPGCPVPGDVDCSGCVDDADLAAVIFEFGSAESGAFGNTDLNNDGIVDDADLAEVIFNFGSGC
jgi:hypothetical protein